MLHLLEALQLLQVKVPGGGPAEARRLSFRALDIEQIGHVYEGLLDHTTKRAAEPFLGLAGTREREPEIPLAELEKLLAKGEADLVKFLKEETGKQEKALSKLLKAELDTQDVARFRTACQSDDALWKRVKPLAGLVRQDNFGYPIVIPKGSVFVTAGTDRRSSGTHYTPRSLTEPIVQYTLEPLVYVGPAEGKPKGEWKLKSAKELLDLKICDMACGSGAFLVQAARYMAERLLEAWDAAKHANPDAPGITPDGEPSTGRPDELLIPADPDERKTYAMRIIAQRCLYGVDKNPLAAEMAKLSLWLLTLAKDKPFEFLDHSIRCGDSLVGLHSIDQLQHFSLKPDADDAVLFKGPLDNAVDEAINLRLKLEDLTANSVDDVERQEKLLKEANEKIARLRCAADLLVAAEFWGGNAKDKLERVRHAAVKSGHYVEKGPTQEFGQVAAKERRGQSMFHWPLEFPEVIVKRGGFDAFVGNPPFMGGRMIGRAFGLEYYGFLDHVRNFVIGSPDFCAYFLLRAYSVLRNSGAFGLLATKTISETGTRVVCLDQLIERGGTIFCAHSRLGWPGVAAVFVAAVHVFKGQWRSLCRLDGSKVRRINGGLEEAFVDATPWKLKSMKGRYGQGQCLMDNGGYQLNETEKQALIEEDPHSAEIIKPLYNGKDLNNLYVFQPYRWVINFRQMTELEARKYHAAFCHVTELVKDYRDGLTGQIHETRYWRFWDYRKKLIEQLGQHERVLASSRHTKYVSFRRVPTDAVYTEATKLYLFFESWEFAVLQSSFHQEWAGWRCATLGETTFAYSTSECLETWPMPDEQNEGIQKCDAIGFSYDTLRESIMADFQLGLTDLYNRFHDPDEKSADIQKLRDLHVEMDQAVAVAYGWDDLELGHSFHETKQGVRFTISESARREVLQRLLKLNHERYAEEMKERLHAKKGAAEKAAPKKRSPTLFEMDEDNE